MTGANDEDLALSRRAASGDGAAFALLVEKYERPLRSFLVRLGGEDPDDVAQDAFLKAWRFAGQYDGRARYSTWLTRIAWRCRIDAMRKGHAPEFEAPSADEPGEAAVVNDMLARLSDNERAALILTAGHGWTNDEAAELLGLPLGTFKSTVARAKGKCRQLWSGGNDG